LALLTSPICGVRSRLAAIVAIVALPLVAYLLVNAVLRLDWDFLLQKLTVLVVWLAAFAAALRVTPPPRSRRIAGAAAGVRGGSFAVTAVAVRAESGRRTMFDRYAVADPSFRLIRDLQARRSADTAAFYALLHSNTLVDRRALRPPDISFVEPLGPAPVRPPNIFLFIIDSLRRD